MNGVSGWCLLVDWAEPVKLPPCRLAVMEAKALGIFPGRPGPSHRASFTGGETDSKQLITSLLAISLVVLLIDMAVKGEPHILSVSFCV